MFRFTHRQVSSISHVKLAAIFLYYPHMYSIQQNAMQSILNEATKHGANIQLSLDEAIKLRCQKYVLTIYRDETHFIHSIIETMPSGRLRAPKIRSSKGTDSFYRVLVRIINANLF